MEQIVESILAETGSLDRFSVEYLLESSSSSLDSDTHEGEDSHSN